MRHLVDFPLVFFALSFALLWLCARVGVVAARNRAAPSAEARQDFSILLTASLTLLALIIGFTFSMAASRYDQRKNYEEAEANAIGTEYLRADLLPAAEAARIRGLLKEYLGQRILFYSTRDVAQLRQVAEETGRLQQQLWTTVRAAAAPEPNMLAALAAAGMNDVLNSQGYTQAAWWDRIPLAAWLLMGLIAVFCNAMFGYQTHHSATRAPMLLILPLLVSVAFALIADIDSPRAGLIHIGAPNLQALALSLH